MSDFSLILGVFRRHKARTLFTILSVAVAFAVFLVVVALNRGLNGLIYSAETQRLVVFSENLQLPLNYAARIAAVPGVKAVTYGTAFAGYFHDQSHWLYVQGVPFPGQLEVNPEQRLTAAERGALIADRQGAAVGAVLARRMGWKVGDTIRIEGGPPQIGGGRAWVFHLAGIFTSDLPEARQQDFVAHFEYLNEGRADLSQKDKLGVIGVFVDDARNVDAVGRAIDAMFVNAQPSTMTLPEQLLAASIVKSFGNTGAILVEIAVAVFFSMLLVTGNTMMNSVRQRMHEFALMRALGFSRRRLVWLVLRESASLIGSGTGLGLLLGWQVCRLIAPGVTNNLPYFGVTWQGLGLAALLALAFALLIGLIPAWRTTTLAIAETLRRN